MDPNECLKCIDADVTLHRSGAGTAARCRDLQDWLDGGGFAPQWDQHPLGTGYFQVWQARVAEKASKPEVPCLLKEFDRVHARDGQWWFWDETDADEEGPYNTEAAARKGLEDYVDTVLGRSIKPGEVKVIANVEVTNHGKGLVTVYIGRGKIGMSGDDSEPMEVTFRSV